MQACLLGSSSRWIHAACGLIRLWRTVHRCKCGIALLQRQLLASLSLCLHICILHWWVLCLWKLWVCCSVGVLHLGLPGRHWPVLPRGVMGQSIWGWCHWWQLAWLTQKWTHSWHSRWSQHLLFRSSHREAIRVDRPWMNRLRNVTMLRNSWSSVTFMGAGRACTASTFSGSGCTPLASYRHAKEVYGSGLYMHFLWVEHNSILAGYLHEVT